MYRNTYVEINLTNLYENVKSIINKYFGYKYYIGVVKSNFYGHGSYSVKALTKAGINYLAVSNLLEAKNIRMYNKTIPILCLEPINLHFLKDALDLNVTLTVSSLEYLKRLKALGENKDILIHLKINSGMNRLGFNDKNELVEALTILKDSFTLEGIYSHFHTLGINDMAYAEQIEKFKEITSLIDLSKIKIVHFGKSSSLINHKKLDFCNGVRLGIILYGINVGVYESRNYIKKIKNALIRKIKKVDDIEYGCKAKIKTSLSLYSEVIEVNFVKKGQFVGYGMSYKTTADGYYAVISAGYADGLRVKGKNRSVFINNKHYEIITVTSGMIIVKADKFVKVGDVAEIYGKNVSLRTMARLSGTNSYDLFSNLHEHLPRVYTEKGKEVYKEIWEVV